MCRRVRLPGRAEHAGVPVAGRGEIVEVELPDDRPAGVEDPLDDYRVDRWCIRECARRVRDGDPGDGQVVLDPDPSARKRPVGGTLDPAQAHEHVQGILLRSWTPSRVSNVVAERHVQVRYVLEGVE